MIKKQNYAEIFFQLTKRHLLVFFRNKIRVFYTLMVPVIIFLVYILFLRRLELSMVSEFIVKHEIGVTDSLTKYVETIVDSWMLSGITALSTLTVSLQTNSTIVCDKENGVNRDFASSPISRNVLIGSYFLFNFLVTFIICFIFVLICLVYLAFMGEFMITVYDFLSIVGVLIYSTISATLFTVFICSFIKHEPTLASLIAIFSTALGFLIGAYMPLGSLPLWVQNICAFFPGTYSCSLLRYSFLSTPVAEITSFLGSGGEAFIEELTTNFGFDMKFFGVSVAPSYQALALAVFIVIFVIANIASGKKLVTVLGGVGKKFKKKK